MKKIGCLLLMIVAVACIAVQHKMMNAKAPALANDTIGHYADSIKAVGQEARTSAWADEQNREAAEKNRKETAEGQEGIPDALEIPRYESPRGSQILYRTGYTVAYDADFKTPQWVGWCLTTERTEGTVSRYNKFAADPDVRGAKAYPSDYKNSGYDRGHIAPAGDMKWSETAMRESFYLSNVCPQNQNLNRGDWKDLEELERTWAVRYGTVSITAGPIYETKRPMRIGANKVAVPDAFFKVLLVGYPNSTRAYGFIFRNEAGSHRLAYYQLTVDEVEERTGMDFFSALPDEVETKVEAQRPSL